MYLYLQLVFIKNLDQINGNEFSEALKIQENQFKHNINTKPFTMHGCGQKV